MLITQITRKEFEEIARTWDEAKRRFKASWNDNRTAPEHDDWNWPEKAAQTTPDMHRFFAVKFEAEWQGLMQMSVVSVLSRRLGFQSKCVLYVEYLEAAPWNLAEYVGAENIRFKRVGVNLIKAAQATSFAEGCNGRLALHSLDNAEGFYSHYGFRNVGYDPEVKLNWFELPGPDEKLP